MLIWSLNNWEVIHNVERFIMEIEGQRRSLKERQRQEREGLILQAAEDVLAEKGYPYQFVLARNAGHSDKEVKRQTLAGALEYVWRGERVEMEGGR